MSRYPACMLVVSLSVALVQGGGAAPLRTVQLEPPFPNDPVRIVKIVAAGVEVKAGVQAWPNDKPGVPFQAGDEWFNDLTVTLKNVSAKKIVFAGVRVSFPDAGDGTPKYPMLGDENVVGQRPEHARHSRVTGEIVDDPARDPILVEPGQEFSLSAISRSRFGDIKEMIERIRPLSSITSVRIGLTPVYFEDGTKWAADLYYRPDLSSPGKYSAMSRNQFDTYKQEVSK